MDENGNGKGRGGRVAWPPYHWIQTEISYSIFEDFWEAKYDLNDKTAYERYLRILELSQNGLSASEIGRILRMNNVGKYLSGKKRSLLTTLRAEHDRIGPPRATSKWSPVRLKPRGTPDSTWIEVPAAIHDLQDIVSVIDQRTPTQDSFEMMVAFAYGSNEELLRDRVNAFGFLLGAMLGDAGKPVKGTSRFPSMTIALTLSKDKPNSGRFGHFTTLCANASLGLAMHRIADAPSSTGRFTDAECYRWLSPASPLIGWTFRVCMGLMEGETTTYDPLRMDWILGAPRDFKVSFLQGMAESDGWVDAGKDSVVIVSSPNDELFEKLFTSLDIRHRFCRQPPITRIEFGTEDGLSLPVFSPRIHSNNYDDLVTMATARTFQERVAIPEPFISRILPILLRTDLNYSKICLEIARATGYKIRSQTAKKYQTLALQQAIPPPPSFFIKALIAHSAIELR